MGEQKILVVNKNRTNGRTDGPMFKRKQNDAQSMVNATRVSSKFSILTTMYKLNARGARR